jgi:hypothetical protein
MMEAILFSETLVLIRTKRRNIPEDGIHHDLSCLYYCISTNGSEYDR